MVDALRKIADLFVVQLFAGDDCRAREDAEQPHDDAQQRCIDGHRHNAAQAAVSLVTAVPPLRLLLFLFEAQALLLLPVLFLVVGPFPRLGFALLG